MRPEPRLTSAFAVDTGARQRLRSAHQAFSRHAVSKPAVSQREPVRSTEPREPSGHERRHADEGATDRARAALHWCSVGVGSSAPVLRAGGLGSSTTGACPEKPACPFLHACANDTPLLAAGRSSSNCVALAMQGRNGVAGVLVCKLGRLFAARALSKRPRSLARDAHGVWLLNRYRHLHASGHLMCACLTPLFVPHPSSDLTQVYPNAKPIQRGITFDYLNRQMVWDRLTAFLLFIMPLVRWGSWWSKTAMLLRLRRTAGSHTDGIQADSPADHCVVCGLLPQMACTTNCGHVHCYYCLAQACGTDQHGRSSRRVSQPTCAECGSDIAFSSRTATIVKRHK